MFDPKFEKAVQHKMEELEFRPSESVWVNIEKAVSDRRRRRVIPFFWRLLIPAVLLTAVGGAYYFGKEAGRKAVTAAVGEKGIPVEDGSGTRTMPKTEKPVEGKLPGTGTLAKTDIPVAGKVPGTRTMAKADIPGHVNAAGVRIATKADGQGEVNEPGRGIATKADKPGVVNDANDANDVNDVNAAKTDVMAAYLFRPGLVDQRIAHGVTGAALKTNKSMINLNTLSRVKRPWEAGFIAGAGIDRLNGQADNQPANSQLYSPSTSFYALSRTPVAKNNISDVRPGASFYAGIYLQKALSERWVFHTGLNLHYYSTQVSVGQQISFTASSSASLLNPRSPAAASAQVVYMVGDQQDYTNRYYMLELPVSMQFRINHSMLLPLFFEGGGSVSRLMGADAIFYNPSTGLYSKNENVLNKTHFNVSSALLVGLPFHGIRIQAGPEVQYGLTPISNAQGLGNQHFFYTGIRLVVLPGRR